ncbi:MAG: DUF1153 domain-containing protein [Pseudomonadota bacterium]
MMKVVSLCEKRQSARVDALREALPPADTKRWVARRKAAVVAAIEAGAISADEACARYGLSDEELSSWRESVARHGVPALFATRLKHYRELEEG